MFPLQVVADVVRTSKPCTSHTEFSDNTEWEEGEVGGGHGKPLYGGPAIVPSFQSVVVVAGIRLRGPDGRCRAAPNLRPSSARFAFFGPLLVRKSGSEWRPVG